MISLARPRAGHPHCRRYLREKRQFDVTLTDRRGNTTSIQYDLQGNQLARSLNGKTVATTLWDGEYLSKTIDARGGATTTKYDTNRQPLQIIHPDGSQESNTYEPVHGQRTSHTDPLGTLSTWSYDAAGRLTTWVQAKGLPEQRTTLYAYDQYGRLTTKTRGAGNATGTDKRTWQYSYANALAETINGLYKAEVIHRRSWPTRESVELATLEWVSWFNHHRLLGSIGYVPPAEAEANYYRQLAKQATTVAA